MSSATGLSSSSSGSRVFPLSHDEEESISCAISNTFNLKGYFLFQHPPLIKIHLLWWIIKYATNTVYDINNRRSAFMEEKAFYFGSCIRESSYCLSQSIIIKKGVLQWIHGHGEERTNETDLWHTDMENDRIISTFNTRLSTMGSIFFWRGKINLSIKSKCYLEHL